MKDIKLIFDEIISQSDDDADIKLFKEFHHIYRYSYECFCPFFLNYIKLNPGQSIIIKPNSPYAYIKGSNFILKDIVECMDHNHTIDWKGSTIQDLHMSTMTRIADFIHKPIESFIIADETIVFMDNNSNWKHTVYKDDSVDFTVNKFEVRFK